MILLAWFDHLEESFSYKEVHFKKFCPPAKTSCPSAENINEIPGMSAKVTSQQELNIGRKSNGIEDKNS